MSDVERLVLEPGSSGSQETEPVGGYTDDEVISDGDTGEASEDDPEDAGEVEPDLAPELEHTVSKPLE